MRAGGSRLCILLAGDWFLSSFLSLASGGLFSGVSSNHFIASELPPV